MGKLILTRHRGQETVITVPPSAEPTIIRHTTEDIRGDKVRQGYSAPPGVIINRREIQDDIDSNGARNIERMSSVELSKALHNLASPLCPTVKHE